MILKCHKLQQYEENKENDAFGLSFPTHCTIFSFSAHWMATSSKTVQKFEFDMMENATGAPPKSQ